MGVSRCIYGEPRVNYLDICSDEDITVLWSRTVERCLDIPLWEDGYICDTGYHLMVPLHAAFKLKMP